MSPPVLRPLTPTATQVLLLWLFQCTKTLSETCAACCSFCSEPLASSFSSLAPTLPIFFLLVLPAENVNLPFVPQSAPAAIASFARFLPKAFCSLLLVAH